MKDNKAEWLINTRQTFKQQILSKSEVDDDNDYDNKLPPLVTDEEEDSDDKPMESMLHNPDTAGSNLIRDNADSSILFRVSRSLPEFYVKVLFLYMRSKSRH